jgi:hypothetical protein
MLFSKIGNPYLEFMEFTQMGIYSFTQMNIYVRMLLSEVNLALSDSQSGPLLKKKERILTNNIYSE